MLKNITLLCLTIAALVASGTFTYLTITNISLADAHSRALRECAEKIPDISNSLNSSEYRVERGGQSNTLVGYDVRNTIYTNFSNYPAFDRCLASKGF